MRPDSETAVGKPKPPARLPNDTAWELDDGEGIATCFRDDSVPHALVQPTRNCGRQEVAGVSIGNALDDDLWELDELRRGVVLACSEQQTDRLGTDSARDERQRLRGGPVEPLGVIDDTQQRRVLGNVRHQAEDREPDKEAIRRISDP